ncbi:ferredoxin [Pseudonocardia sp.]|jgi:ferredoxin|uniref:ferredoxin n=1 Tax=Pseudonocardia sp. TaxID=60912 RepID=UPI00261C7089|nr:ferredoxin [Pseudonocardia sp.]MCW2718646.1 fdx 3 [Pseudonocardia sp.]
MHLHVDMTRCVGNGMCAITSPEHFQLSDDGTLVVLKHDVGPDDGAVQEAMDSCPVGAISLKESR